MTTTTVPLQIMADGVDTFEAPIFDARTLTTLRVYTPASGTDSRAAIDIKMPVDVVAETIADLAYTLKDNAAYGALAAAVASFFESQAVTS